MSREKAGYEQEFAKQIASAFVEEARKQGVTTIRDIYYKPALKPTIYAVLNTSREARLPGSGTPQEKDFRRILAVNAQVRDRFTADDPEDSPFKFLMLSAPDIGEEVIKGLTSDGFKKQPYTLQAAKEFPYG